MARQKTPEQIAKARSAASVKGAKTRAYNSTVRTATEAREKHEANHPERYQGVESMPGYTTHRQAYKDMNIGVHDEPGQTSWGQQHLPGMEHPAVVNTPPRWEDMPQRQQQRVARNAAKFGVTHESAVRALGAQVDQGAVREGQAGTKHRSFYAAEGHHPDGEMTPRTRLTTSARENGVPFEQQAIANSITSPKNKFSVEPKSGPNKGKRIYPNDMQASHAIQHLQAGGSPETARADTGAGGMHGNSRKAAGAVQKMQGGASAAESWKAGPKTGPYHNSWVDPHGSSQYWVSDIHSGGGGIAPHLSVKDRESYLNIDGIHSFNDHVARTVMHQRGVQSMTGMQSMQWNEERTLRHEQDSRYGERTDTFAGLQAKKRPEIPGQTKAF